MKVTHENYSAVLMKVTHENYSAVLMKVTHENYSAVLMKVTHANYSAVLMKVTHENYSACMPQNDSQPMLVNLLCGNLGGGGGKPKNLGVWGVTPCPLPPSSSSTYV